MASVIGKRRADGRTYYYLVESARVDGKPRIVSQQYLGSAEEVEAKLSGAGPGTPIRSLHKKFGDLAAVWSVLARLDVTGIVDTLVPRLLDLRPRRLVGLHRRPPLGETGENGAGPPPDLGRAGPHGRDGSARDRG
jgi:hypothetical protein